MSPHRLIVSFCSELTIVYCVCFVAGEPGALPVPLAEPQCQTQWRGWHGAAQQDQWGRHRGQPQEEIYGWLHLCILLLTIAAHSPARNSWVPSHPCYSQNSWMVIHGVTRAVSNSWVLGGNACPLRLWGGGKRPLCAGLHPDLPLLLLHQCLDLLWLFLMAVQNVNKVLWEIADCIMVKATVLNWSIDAILFLIVAGI